LVNDNRVEKLKKNKRKRKILSLEAVGTKSLLNLCPAKSSGAVRNNFSAIRLQHEQSCAGAIA
jgi:hypothetical protein